jgi:hypothetical protein
MGFNEIFLKKECITGNLEKVRFYLERANPNELLEYFQRKRPIPIKVPALFFACLGEDGMNLSKKDISKRNENYPKRQAVIALLLNDNRVDVNLKTTIDSHQYTVLDLLLQQEALFQNEIAQLKAHPRVKDFLLAEACRDSDITEVESLLATGANPNTLFESKIIQEDEPRYLAPALLFACLGDRSFASDDQEAEDEENYQYRKAVITRLLNHKGIDVNASVIEFIQNLNPNLATQTLRKRKHAASFIFWLKNFTYFIMKSIYFWLIRKSMSMLIE